MLLPIPRATTSKAIPLKIFNYMCLVEDSKMSLLNELFSTTNTLVKSVHNDISAQLPSTSLFLFCAVVIILG